MIIYLGAGVGGRAERTRKVTGEDVTKKRRSLNETLENNQDFTSCRLWKFPEHRCGGVAAPPRVLRCEGSEGRGSS